MHFDSWKELLDWLPQATESQLMTVFVWANDQEKVPPGETRFLADARREAFEQLVGRAKEPLRRFLLRRLRCRDGHMADDVVQEVLILVYLRAEQYDPDRSFWGWLYRVARNKYIDTLRRQRPGDLGRGGTGKPDDALEEWLQNVALTKTTPESAALAQERRQLVDGAIGRLPALQQTVVRLRLDGVQGKEIALRIGRSQAYVSQSYHEALELIRDQVDE
ncbi:MAG: sigma-70 family RNA polymerase sigma factor [Gemmataceae bacterium]|nr:sigma-70 family RNA polymerase sigma factor [Gemmataceae bacterium]